MSIIPLRKVTVFGMPADRQAVLSGLQRLGCMHLIPLRSPPKTAEFETSDPAEKARKVLRYIMDVPRRRHQVKDKSMFDLDRVVGEALANKQKRREAEDKKLLLVERLNELAPWGDFRLPSLDELGGYRLWFYQVPHLKVASFREGLKKLELPWQLVNEDNRYTYFVIVAQAHPDADALPVPGTPAGSISPQELNCQLEQIELELDEIEVEHESLSRWIFLLSKHLAQAEDRDALDRAQAQTAEQDGVFLIQGWLPERDLKRLDAFTKQQGLAFLAEPPKPEDKPPTLLENLATFTGGQDLIAFYTTPGYRDWDPSIVVFFSFATFFAMILCDAGYAMVLAAVVAYFWRSLGKSPAGRHFRMLAVVGLAFAVVYGVLTGSYFGIELPADSLLARLRVLDINDNYRMMKLAISVGCLHIILANAIVAYHSVGIADKSKPLGWIAVILGLLLMYLSGGAADLFHLGIGLGVGGLLTIFLLSSDRRLDSPRSLLLRLLDGLMSLANISKLFGDVMSYLRLFALALASVSLAFTFNQLASQIAQSETMPALSKLIALLILLLGHGINLLLGVISSFVHGLRLNYIEFFNWSLSEEGTPFQAFAKKETNL